MKSPTKYIPNFFTLVNLFLGCLAILYTLQSGLIPLYTSTNRYLLPDVNEAGTQYISIPERMCLASVLIGIAAVIDFLDGFVARAFNATSAIGKQLDSLADVVTFGVAPGMIMYQFLRLSYAQQPDGLDINTTWLLPAFLIPCAAAYRLARFNTNAEETVSFKGVPTPAVGLLIASFPLLFWYGNIAWFTSLLINKWFLYAVILIVCYIMISTLRMLALKLKSRSMKQLLPFIALALIAAIAAFVAGWLAVPITFVAYVLLSLFFKQPAQ